MDRKPAEWGKHKTEFVFIKKGVGGFGEWVNVYYAIKRLKMEKKIIIYLMMDVGYEEDG